MRIIIFSVMLFFILTVQSAFAASVTAECFPKLTIQPDGTFVISLPIVVPTIETISPASNLVRGEIIRTLKANYRAILVSSPPSYGKRFTLSEVGVVTGLPPITCQVPFFSIDSMGLINVYIPALPFEGQTYSLALHQESGHDGSVFGVINVANAQPQLPPPNITTQCVGVTQLSDGNIVHICDTLTNVKPSDYQNITLKVNNTQYHTFEFPWFYQDSKLISRLCFDLYVDELTSFSGEVSASTFSGTASAKWAINAATPESPSCK